MRKQKKKKGFLKANKKIASDFGKFTKLQEAKIRKVATKEDVLVLARVNSARLKNLERNFENLLKTLGEESKDPEVKKQVKESKKHLEGLLSDNRDVIKNVNKINLEKDKRWLLNSSKAIRESEKSLLDLKKELKLLNQ